MRALQVLFSDIEFMGVASEKISQSGRVEDECKLWPSQLGYRLVKDKLKITHVSDFHSDKLRMWKRNLGLLLRDH
jgi:hypothetical protein